MRQTFFVEVILPLPLPGHFTYRVPYDLNGSLEIGQRVVVQFGRKKLYTALIYKIHEKVPQNYEVKYILSVLDSKPIVNSLQFKLWHWMANYYMCTVGEVMNAALPSSLKLASESKIIINPDFDGDVSQLNEIEYTIAEALQNNSVLTLTEVSTITQQQKIIPLIKTLIEKGVVLLEEEIKQRYKPKKETFVKLTEQYLKEKELKNLLDSLEKKAPKQVELLMGFLSMQPNINDNTEVKKSELINKTKSSHAIVASLAKKGVIHAFEKEVTRLVHYEKPVEGTPQLSDVQNEALNKIQNGFEEKDVVLLHGVTGSGKTEVYINLMQEAINNNKQVLYLLPEIALTTQIINRLRRFFGNKVTVYHSRFNQNERAEVWSKLNDADSELQIVLGARSAIFMPFSKLGLIIVDEEHENTFKQYNPAPRYNARDTAIFLAQLHKAKVLLGSATPAVESYFNATSNKYKLVELKQRYGNIQMPEILVVDIKEETKRKKMHSHFSSYMVEQITEALEKKEQIILFQNRRGFSHRIECEVCNWSPQCKNCDVTLTYHKYYNHLRCHYCGYTLNMPSKCSACGSPKVLLKGFGTEKIEDEIPIFFPKAKAARMDLDSTRSKHAYQRFINDFEDRKIDILIGTQMVTKGLDFDNVSIVGILNADNMLNFPDFRAFERSYQLMAQVSGRAGRKNKRGKVIIQSFNPYHAIIRNVIDNDYISMYKDQILERRNFKYPPYYRLVQLTLKHKDPQKLNISANNLAFALRKEFGKRILGPEFPMVSKIKNEYLKNILFKIEKGDKLLQMKQLLKEQLEEFSNKDENKGIRLIVDVDPM